jgi:hypothetical protein
VTICPTVDTTKKCHNLRVVRADSASSTITVKYGGAPSDIYSLLVSSSTCGNFVTEGVTLTSIMQVNDFNPKEGSVHGGTLVTITGENFSDIATDNPVKFGYEWVGGVNHYCYVQTTSATEITCRMATDYSR